MNDLLKRYDILYTIVIFLLMIPAEQREWFSLLEDETLAYRHIARWSIADPTETAFNSESMFLVNTNEEFYQDYGGFPLRRKDYGELAVRLKDLGAKVVAIDALMDYPSSYGEDPDTAALFQRAGNVLLVSKADIADDGRVFKEIDYPTRLLRAQTRSGYSNIASESALKTRMTRLRVFPEATTQQDGWPFSIQALSMYKGVEPKLTDGLLEIGDISVPLDKGLDFYIDFPLVRNGSQFLSDEHSRSVMDILKMEDLNPDEIEDLRFDIKDKIVLVGDTSEIAHDIFDTPVGQVYGVEIIANSIDTLLKGVPLRPAPLWLEIFITLGLLALVLLTTRVTSAPTRILITVGIIAAFWTVAFVLYAYNGVIVSMMYNTIAVVLGASLIFMRYYLTADENLVQSERESAESNRMLALAFQGQGQLDMAFDKFRKVPLDDSTADLVYNLGLDYERKRQFNKAVSVYEYLKGWNPGYRDIQQRMMRAAQIDASPMKGSSHPGGGSIVVGEGMEKPMLGRYEITRELGQGAMGKVYFGVDPKINRTVAIKTMQLDSEFEGDALTEAKERFFREAQSAGRLNHPNIVAIYDAGEEQDLAYIAMEFLKGKDLSSFTAADNLLPLEEVLEIGIQCAEALNYAHGQGVVHRDIKPSNVMYDRDTKTIKLTDFGIARITDSSKTRTGTVLGTPNYMSPEQALGDRVDGRSDLFSLGVVLYQLTTGRLPFQGESMASLMYKIVNEPHPDIKDVKPEVPGSVRRVIDNALRKEPGRRYQTGVKLAEHLRVCIERVRSTKSA